MQIYIVFTKSTSWISRLIRFITRSRVSHVMIDYPSELWGGRWVAEATLPKVHKIPEKKAWKNVSKVFECKFELKEGLHSISDHIGEWYDFKGFFILAWFSILWHVLKLKVRYPLYSTSQPICSELVARMFMACKLPGVEFWNPEKMSPEQLLIYCESSNKDFVEVKEKDWPYHENI